ncbi:hypothetical protein [Bacillus sp. Au-Bac7]|uniref:hypothetical protein n=1 Tax=Bacillus sp. Au-Bac7 TaxID=2906458 RepID=UPI001E28D962|nr:hypothetical protein [Bacillus sp. Au-Bac7]MCE4051896.1 hypothetical protein [Bacillus sp. Au-Bac7]
MRQTRRELMVEIFNNAVENKNYFYPSIMYAHNMEERKEDYKYLEATNLIVINEIIDSEEWEISLTPAGIERAQVYKDKSEEKEVKLPIEEDPFEEQLEGLCMQLKCAETKQEQMGCIIAFLAQTEGLRHIKGNAYMKLAEIIIAAYEEGLYGDTYESAMQSLED